MIWSELGAYSGRFFPVLPAQAFTAGLARPGVIYLDVSIAGDPDVNVTRFFLAHEWGHEVNGDPLVGLIAARYNFLTASTTTAEDRADAYAAKFMGDSPYDVRPVLAFLCDLPDGGPDDSHSSGPDRAVHVARIYGYVDGYACPAGNDELLVKEIRALADAATGDFAGLMPMHTKTGDYEPIPLTLNGHDSLCFFDEDDPGDCEAKVSPGVDASMSRSEAMTALEKAIDAALPGWTKDGQSYGGRIIWWQNADLSGPNIDLHGISISVSSH